MMLVYLLLANHMQLVVLALSEFMLVVSSAFVKVFEQGLHWHYMSFIVRAIGCHYVL